MTGIRRSRASFIGTLGLGAFSTLAISAAEPYTFRLSCVDTPQSSSYAAAARFADAVAKRSNGQLKIEVYGNGQLATERESVEGLTNGVIDLAVQTTTQLIPLFPRYQVFDMPFIFKDLDTAFKVFDGQIGDEFFGELQSKGITGLTWGTSGFKELETTGKAVASPDDMKGLRIRIQSSPVYVATYQALGAVPVAIDLSEVYVSLMQHTIDGFEVSLQAAVAGKFYNVVKHVAMTNQSFATVVLLGSKKKIDALPSSLQTILKNEGKSLVPFWRTLVAQRNAAAMQTLKDNGVAFNDVPYAAFRRAVEPVYASYRPKIGAELIDRIGRIAGGSG